MTLDVRVGGGYSSLMVMPSGESTYLEGRFTRVEPGRLLAYTFQWRGQELVTNVTVEFADAPGGGTTVTLRHDGFPNTEAVGMHRQGWDGSFDRLATLLAS